MFTTVAVQFVHEPKFQGHVCTGMLRHAFRRVGEVIFLLHFLAPDLDLLPTCAPKCNKGSKDKEGSSRKCSKKITSPPTRLNACRIIFCQPKAHSVSDHS